MLTFAKARIDVQQLAEAPISKFGSISVVLEQDSE
jgi:hypothetical protein